MFRRFHLFMTFLLIAGTAVAQGIRENAPRPLPEMPASQRTPLMQFERSPRFAPRQSVIPVDPDRQLWWGYFQGTSMQGTVGYGSSTAETYWGAIAVPASEELVQGKTIKAVRFAVAGVSSMSNFHFWIADHLPNSLADVQLDIPISTWDINNYDFTEIELPTPYQVPAQTFYAGYTFEITQAGSEADYPMVIQYNRADIDDSFYFRSSTKATTWTSDGQEYGPLAIQLLLDGEFPRNTLEVSPTFQDVYALADGTAEASITLTSKGLGEISSINYIVGDANADGEEEFLAIEPFGGMDAQQLVRVPLKADAVSGRTPRYITITKVNGVENTMDNCQSEGYFVTLSQAVPRRTVVEEFTGTWCGWCPRGITGMEKVNERFGDKAITIVVHGDDPMTIDYGISAGSYPSAYVDRGVAADPYFGNSGEALGICDLVSERNQVYAEASVTLQQPVVSKSGVVSFKTDIVFNYNNTKAPYALGYVLVADGLTGSGRNWAQANYYSGKTEYSSDENLKPWVEASSYVYPMTFDHVAIAAKGMNTSGSAIAAPIVDGKLRTVSGSLSLVGNELIQSFDNLKVVAVLFNIETGYIVNADIQPVQLADDFSQNRMQVKAFEQTGVVKGDVAEVEVPVVNFGRNGIRSIDYTVHYGGKTLEQHMELAQPIISYGAYTNLKFKVPASAETGIAKDTIEITKLNGAENEATSGKIATGNIMTVAKLSKRRTVVEEFTGTWCMWCPRGAAGLKRAHAEYPDDAVLMAIHGGRNTEPMTVSTFSNLLGSISGFPSAKVNRYHDTDPYMGDDTSSEGFGLGAVIESENNQIVEASVELHQPTMEKSTGVITFTTDVTFQINRKSAPYLLSYVLVGDGLKGEGDDWKQVNAYAAYYAGGYTDDPYMNEVCNIWDIYADVEFDHVAMAGLGVDAGVTNSLKTLVTEGQVQSHSSKFATRTNKLVKMAKKMRVIAMLYDKTAKRFINADEKEVVVFDAVEDVPAQAAEREAVRYSLDGKQLARPSRGINLVRMADGSFHKVLVK